MKEIVVMLYHQKESAVSMLFVRWMLMEEYFWIAPAKMDF